MFVISFEPFYENFKKYSNDIEQGLTNTQHSPCLEPIKLHIIRHLYESLRAFL